MMQIADQLMQKSGVTEDQPERCAEFMRGDGFGDRSVWIE